MSEVYTLSSHQQNKWHDLLLSTCQYDVYHLPEYHILAERNGEGEARLIVYEDGDHFIAMPLLFRSIKLISGFDDIGDEYRDATSVYGYPGPVASCGLSESVIAGFCQSLSRYLVNTNTISVFSRLNPLLNQVALVGDLGEIKGIGKTVSINLTLSENVQWSQYRTNHKRDINKLKKLGAIVLQDHEKHFLSQFVTLYNETMERVEAAKHYFLPLSYYEDILSMREQRYQLFVCKLGDEIIAGGLFSYCEGIVQYHLGGTSTLHLNLSPMKLVFEEVRRWAINRGANIFHLGGGVGSQNDSLFEFKAGFSSSHHQFQVWNWIVQPDIYRNLEIRRRQWLETKGRFLNTTSFFPAYRAN
ncbi:MAG TPA: GNAT family N-acetyltransferase [Chloroflexota bacterium]|nr:GNAT family N-acetyltransferase [Chloroflexota bacterium]HUM68519.1 GNAT family N-acetyltransferase [Chloroflexota bacterium]